MLNDDHIDTKLIVRGEDLMTTEEKKVQLSRFTIRTSGRRVFRRCLRKWGFQSSMKRNLQPRGTEKNINFWFGSAMHFAMEDYFGYNRFGDLHRAFQAYYAAFQPADRPAGADEHYYLGLGMLDYFRDWYKIHNQDQQFQTVWLDKDKNEVPPGTPGAEPMVEQSFILDLGIRVWADVETEQILDIRDEDVKIGDSGKPYVDIWEEGQAWPTRHYVIQVPICYHGTLDRVVKDAQGRWWIMDWKTAKSADTNKLDTDDQISAYMWAAEQFFGHPIHGFVYVQLTKDVPKPPKRVTNGTLSTDKKQKTTAKLFREELIKDYTEVRKAPMKMQTFLETLLELETPEGDRFVRWDLVTRNHAQKISTYHHILGEVRMMVNPSQHLFPNPTRDCIWDCNFRDACLMMDKGEHQAAENWLNVEFEPRPRGEDGNIDPWRKNIPWPDAENSGKAIGTLVEQMELSANATLNLILPDKYIDLEEK